MFRAAGIVALLLVGVPAVAQDGGAGAAQMDPDEARAKELFQNGAQLYAEGRYVEAVAAWKESHRLSGYPVLLYNIADAYERDGNLAKAMEYLNQYRALAPKGEQEALNRRLQRMEGRWMEQRKAEEAARLAAGSTNTVTPVGPSEVVPPPRKLKVLPLALTGVGVASLGTGGYFAYTAGVARSDAERLCGEGNDGAFHCPSQAKDAVEYDKTASIIADSSFAIGAVAIGAGVVFAFVDASSPRSGVRWAAGAGPGGASLSVTGGF